MIVAVHNSYLLSCWDSKTAIFKRSYCQVNNSNVIAEDINRNHMLRVGLFFATNYLVVFEIQIRSEDLEIEKSINAFENLVQMKLKL